MCRQPVARCRNNYCDGFAVILPVVPCAKRPNCELRQTRIPTKDRPSLYCPECQKYTRAERKARLNKALRQRIRARGETANVAEGAAVHAEVEPQAESSSVGEARGTLGVGILSGSGQPRAEKLKGSDARLLYAEEDAFLGSSLGDTDTFLDEPPTAAAVDAQAYGGDSPMSTFFDPISAPTDLPPFHAPDPFRADAFVETFGLGNPKVTPVSSFPQSSIEPGLLALDAMYPNGFNTFDSVQEAEQLFGVKASRPEPSESNKPDR